MDYAKLKQDVDRSNDSLRMYREAMARDVKQFAGSNMLGGDIELLAYADHSAESFDSGRPLVNMLEVLIGIYMQKLVSGNPQCLVSSTDPSLKTISRYFTLAMNRIITRIGLESSLKLGVLQSLFSIGVMKVGITLEDEGKYGSGWHYSAIPYADSVTFTDYVFDTTAERWDLIQWEGNYYKDLLDDVRNDPRNNPDAVQALNPVNMTDTFGREDPLQDAMLELGGGSVLRGADEDFVRLVDIYVPREKLFVTYAADSDIPLRTQKYVGPEKGPYHKLWYMPVPGRLMPVPPTKTAAPMARLIDLMWKDMGKQASRQKTLLLCTEGDNGERDADRINMASDGQAIPVSNPNSCNEKATGGVSQQTMAAAAAAREWYDWSNGNLATLGGLGNSAPTLGQEQLLSASSNGRMVAMQGEVVNWTTSIIQSIAWYIWHDPACRVRTLDKIAGTDIQIPVEFPIRKTADGQEIDDRAGRTHAEFTFDITPFSLQATTPAQQMQVLDSVVNTLLPAAQLMAQQGITIDFEAWVDAKAGMLNIPRLKDVIKSQVPEPQPKDGPEFEKPPKPANTTRTYERVRGGGPSSVGANRAMAASMSASSGGMSRQA